MQLQNFTAKQLFMGGLFVPIILGLLVGGAILISGGGSAPEQHILGAKNAQIQLVEYSDFECPFCQNLTPTLKKLLNDYSGKISLEYRHFPLSFHPMAQPAAEAAECAAEQDKFWEYHDGLFANQSNLSPALFQNLAQSLGLNMNRFNECVSSGKYIAKIQAQLAEGQQRGVQGTPGTFVNDEFVNGAQPYEVFKEIIDRKLAL